MLSILKDKRYRLIGVLILLVGLYAVWALIAIVLSLVTGNHWIRDTLKFGAVLVNGFCIYYAISVWRTDYVRYTAEINKLEAQPKPKYTEEDVQRYKDIGVDLKMLLEPFPYRKARRQSAWMWSICILVNIASIVYQFI